MSKFDVSLMPLQDNIESLNNITSDYGKCVESLGTMSKYFNRDGYGDFVVAINNIYKQALEDQEALSKMGVALSDILNQYLRTENLNMGNKEDIPTDSQEEDIGNLLGDIEDLRDIELYKLIKALVVRGMFGNNVWETLSEILGGTYITSGKANGVRYFKLMNKGMTNAECAKWLNENLDGDWSKDLVRRLKRGDISVYDTNGLKLMRPRRFFTDIKDARISDYLDNLDLLKESGWKAFKNNFDVLDDFKVWGDATTLGKVGKGLGVVGNVITVGTDVYDNCYDPTTHQWNFTTETVVDATCDVGVDIAVGAGATAVGAAVGSFIVPPVGTVVGAGVGVAVDVVANLDFADFDGDGNKDSLVDGTKVVVKGAIDVVGDGIDAAGDWLGDLFG